MTISDKEEILDLLEVPDIEAAIKSFLKKTRGTDFYSKVTPINTSFAAYRENKNAGLNIDGELEKIVLNLTNTLDQSCLIAGKMTPSNDTDAHFEILSKLNFHKQTSNFKELVTDRKISIFVIRGDGECGQTWLLHQLIAAFPFEGERSVTVFEFNNCSFDDFLENISKKLETSSKFDKNIKAKANLSPITESLVARAETKHQFIILKKSFNFIHSLEFNDFYNHLLDDLHIRFRGKKSGNKIVIFFVEEENTPYTIKDPDCECHFFGDADHVNKINFIEKWKSDTDTHKVKIAGFHAIEKFDTKLLSDWVDGITNLKILNHFCNIQQIQEFLNECDCGNPHLVIEKISKKLEYYSWKKY